MIRVRQQSRNTFYMKDVYTTHKAEYGIVTQIKRVQAAKMVKMKVVLTMLVFAIPSAPSLGKWIYRIQRNLSQIRPS